MRNGLISILIGILILLNIVFKIELGLNSTLLIIFSLIFLIDGLNFKKMKGERFGSLIFGIFLILEAFKIIPILSFWQIILVLIASYMIGHGLYSAFYSGTFLFSTKNDMPKEFKIPYNKLDKEISLNIDADWTKINLNSNNIEHALIAKYISNSKIYNMSLNNDENIITFKNKINVTSPKIPERAKVRLQLNKNILYHLNSDLNVADVFYDFRETNIKDTYISATASKIVIIPIDKSDSTMDINLEISSLTIKLPRNIGLILTHSGDLNFKTFEGLIKTESGSYISSNYDNSEYICHLTISSDVSKLNVVII
ncbi:hypothetical protein OSSY52_19740 [Tepiditoga spiralis]|uniref:Cell wall-active antibiotics response LiaF-like C-terminal domain-containing protein n=1 Tax=Tepiditoga spiralis TaxID=2108365 RepID=A0A7G1G9Y7_9BACT|nr:hypothetical protein [Tepiditoga spiralis]BBE31833.1 hypothetical protein OSSY52_19740 [Tepiditoga spiralis]